MSILAIDLIKKYPTACTPAVKWIKSLPVGTTAFQAWEICPDGSWMAWITGMISVPDRERWVWADLARLWAADTLDAAEVKHSLRECEEITNKRTAANAAYSAANVADSAYSAANAAVNVAANVAYAAANVADAAADVTNAAYAAAYAADVADAADAAADIRKRIKNPFDEDVTTC